MYRREEIKDFDFKQFQSEIKFKNKRMKTADFGEKLADALANIMQRKKKTNISKQSTLFDQQASYSKSKRP